MIEVQTKDLKKGDLIVACASNPTLYGWTKWKGVLVTSELTKRDGKIYTFTCIENGREVSTEREDYLWFQVERPLVELAPTKKVIDPFPGTCEWCGERAYVSALAVEHKDESNEKVRKCPARRV